MNYLIYLFILIFAFLLLNIIRKTVARSFFEFNYQKALKKRSNAQSARFWGHLYYSTFGKTELRAGGIRDTHITVENDIESHHFQIH